MILFRGNSDEFRANARVFVGVSVEGERVPAKGDQTTGYRKLASNRLPKLKSTDRNRAPPAQRRSRRLRFQFSRFDAQPAEIIERRK